MPLKLRVLLYYCCTAGTWLPSRGSTEWYDTRTTYSTVYQEQFFRRPTMILVPYLQYTIYTIIELLAGSSTRGICTVVSGVYYQWKGTTVVCCATHPGLYTKGGGYAWTAERRRRKRQVVSIYSDVPRYVYTYTYNTVIHTTVVVLIILISIRCTI